MKVKAIKKLIPNFVKTFIKSFQSEAFFSGHYYSAVPSLKEIKANENAIYNIKDELDSIHLNHSKQLEVLTHLEALATKKTFDYDADSIRFNIENDSFSYDDAPVLHYMLRHIKPKRIIEVGSGHSSAVMLDTKDFYINDYDIELTFIDIDLDNLKAVLIDNDYKNIKLIEQPIQTVDLSIFDHLEANDLFFVDSSHVSKIGSDLHTILFKILPRLKSGVYIHFHDIRYPFQYKKDLTYKKVFWNEAYLLRAFLMYNNDFEIVFWLNYLTNSDNLAKEKLSFLPLKLWDEKFNEHREDFSGAGGSIYLKKA